MFLLRPYLLLLSIPNNRKSHLSCFVLSETFHLTVNLLCASKRSESCPFCQERTTIQVIYTLTVNAHYYSGNIDITCKVAVNTKFHFLATVK